ncbi:MAG: hypothetical protein J6C77_05465 [Muribaculaceae bacterium]|nr:hypothetical protein [Muribaculaceae bacterium]
MEKDVSIGISPSDEFTDSVCSAWMPHNFCLNNADVNQLSGILWSVEIPMADGSVKTLSFENTDCIGIPAIENPKEYSIIDNKFIRGSVFCRFTAGGKESTITFPLKLTLKPIIVSVTEPIFTQRTDNERFYNAYFVVEYYGAKYLLREREEIDAIPVNTEIIRQAPIAEVLIPDIPMFAGIFYITASNEYGEAKWEYWFNDDFTASLPSLEWDGNNIESVYVYDMSGMVVLSSATLDCLDELPPNIVYIVRMVGSDGLIKTVKYIKR